MPTRHSRFGGILKLNRHGNTSKIISNPYLQQRNKNLNNNRYKLRKINQRYSRQLNSKIHPTSLNENLIYNSTNVRFIKKFATEFYENGFTPIVESCFREISNDTEKVEENDKIHLFVLIAFFLKFGRLLNKENQSKQL